jgi:S-formylglutathione hydrolase FrmB
VNTDGIELRTRSASLLLVLGLLVGGVGAAPAPASAQAGAGVGAGHGEDRSGSRFADGHGIHVVSARHTSARVWKLVVRTGALQRTVHVDLVLPRGYASGSRRYPTLYLLHGTSGGADDWIDSGRLRSATSTYPMITVLPDGGYDHNGGSFWTNWVAQHTSLGRANWETFHIRQLVPWVDANLRTVRSRSARAIAGLSQGGFGSMSYAARHPDLFVAAASFSGAPDIARNPAARALGGVFVGSIMTGLNGVRPNAPFGDPVTNAINWRGHNPASLVTNLAHTDLRLWTGNGEAGPLDPPGPPAPDAAAIEAVVHQSTLFFADAADAAGVDHRLHDYGAGTHTWPYWARDLRAWLPSLRRVFARHEPAPSVVSFRAVEHTWRQWGWRVATHRAARQAWSSLRNASRSGFTLTGGPATVTTPSYFRPGRVYRVAYRGATGPRRVTAGDGGRLRLRVEAGSARAVVRFRAADAGARARTR